MTPVFRTVGLGHIPQAVEPLFVLSRRLVTQGRMHSRPIVEGLDVVEHRQAGSFAREKGSGSFSRREVRTIYPGEAAFW